MSAGVKGTVFNIQKFSTEDGPGIRSTVFLKGCSLRCLWCHNPESLSPRPQLVWHGKRCIGDLACLGACPRGALSSGEKGVVIDREKCEGCGACAHECPSGALEVLGREMSSVEVTDEVLKDRLFYEKSGGGVTFSGGEPTLQKDFLAAMLRAMRGAGVHAALDTCGQNRREVYEEIIQLADLVLYDLKSLDEDAHRRATGAGLDLILDNLRYIDSTGVPIWIRTPVIPGWTASGENIRRIARFISDELEHVERFDLLSYSNLCITKYEELGMEYGLRDAPLMREAEMRELEAITLGEGVKNVVVSGLMRRE